MRLMIRETARADIGDIWRYTAKTWHVDQADAYVAAIDRAIAQIGADPASAPRCDWIRQGYRRLRAGSHFVFARIEGDAIVVIRVLHERMNFAAHLDDVPDILGQDDQG